MSPVIDVTVPDIGDFKNIPVIEILVKVGDYVAKDSPLVVLESDKATLDVPSPQSGTIDDLQIAVGDKVSVGSALLTMNVACSASPEALAEQKTSPSLLPIHDLVTIPEQSAKVVSVRAESVNRETKGPIFPRSPHASPSIRRMSREFGIDLGAVRGTGPRGRIIKDDLHHFVKESLAAAPIPTGGNDAGGLHLAAWPAIDFSKFGKIERAPLSKIRQISGSNLTRNSIVIPHVTNFEDADITNLETFRRALKLEAKSTNTSMTILPFLIMAVAATLAKFPTFNSSLDGEELIIKQYFHIGFAADTPNGLVVPVIREVDRKGITDIAIEASALAAQAREGKLKAADMQGGCFTVSSLGGIGGTGFTPIINAPEVAILGVTRAQMRPVWNGEAFAPRLILPMSLSWDHRVVDGVAAARFLVHLSKLLEDFRRVLL